MSMIGRERVRVNLLTQPRAVAYVGHMTGTTRTATDPVTASFIRFAKREPREGDFYSEAPEKVLDETGTELIEIRNCWTVEDGRWEGFISIQRGGTWAH